jgi:hypothetical protein
MSLISMLSAAQGGQFFANAGIAAGISQAQARSAISAMAPAIATKLKAKASDNPDAFDALLDLLEEGGDLDDVEALTGAEGLSDGAEILKDLYGSDDGAALALHAADLSKPQLKSVAAISATSVLASLAASQPATLASDTGDTGGGGGGLLATIIAAITKGLVQGAARQLAPKRRRRRRYGYSYGYARPRRRRTRRPPLDQIFDAILKR